MFKNLSDCKIFVKPGPMDLRKQMAGLSVVVQNQLKENPFPGNLYLFCNRRRNLLRILYWELNGFFCWQKRLEKDTFSWPKDEEEVREITERHIRLLLE